MATNKNTTPVYAVNSILTGAFQTNSNTAKDGSGTLTFLVSGSTNETRIESIQFAAATTGQTTVNTAMVCRAFVAPAGAGSSTSATTAWLVGEVALAAVTPSASAVGATGTIYFNPPLTLQAGQYLYSTQSAYSNVGNDKMAVIVRGASF